jgi:hypothetical protein
MILLWASRVKSGKWHMFCISKPMGDRGNLVLFLESAGQIYPETGLKFEAQKCVLANVIILMLDHQLVDIFLRCCCNLQVCDCATDSQFSCTCYCFEYLQLWLTITLLWKVQ